MTEEARAKLSSSEAQRTGELDKSDRSRSQLMKMSEQLLARMKAATPDQIKKGDAFSKKRQRSWDLLAKREAKALAGTMAAKRAKGTKKKPSDGYSEFRGPEKGFGRGGLFPDATEQGTASRVEQVVARELIAQVLPQGVAVTAALNGALHVLEDHVVDGGSRLARRRNPRQHEEKQTGFPQASGRHL